MYNEYSDTSSDSISGNDVVYKGDEGQSKFSNDFVPYMYFYSLVSIWGAMPSEPLPMSMPSASAPLPQISSYTSD